eukprot:1718931-Rhodomonas_salina.1
MERACEGAGVGETSQLPHCLILSSSSRSHPLILSSSPRTHSSCPPPLARTHSSCPPPPRAHNSADTYHRRHLSIATLAQPISAFEWQ